MIGLIGLDGDLQIERNGVLHKQYCQYDENRNCNDTCVKFGEPHKVKHQGKKLGTVIKLCGKDRLFFTEFSDERIN